MYLLQAVWGYPSQTEETVSAAHCQSYWEFQRDTSLRDYRGEKKAQAITILFLVEIIVSD